MLEVPTYLQIPTMPPYIPSTPRLRADPQRLVLIHQCCFYCNSDTHVECYRLWHLFGILHCPAHAQDAKEDGEDYLRSHNMMRLCDIHAHPVLGPFLDSLGNSIPVLRTSGIIEQEWRLPLLDEQPLMLKADGEWAILLMNGEGSVQKYVRFSQFTDPRILVLLKEPTHAWMRKMLEALESL